MSLGCRFAAKHHAAKRKAKRPALAQLLKRYDDLFAAIEAKGKRLKKEEHNSVVKARNMLFSVKKKMVLARYGVVVKQDFSTGKGWRKRVRGVGEARQVLKEYGKSLGIHYWECNGAQSNKLSQPGTRLRMLRKEGFEGGCG